METLLAGDPASPNYLNAVVALTWGKERGQMNVEQTRHLAVSLMEAAMVAETDELLVHFLHARIGLPLEPAVAALRDLRQMRKDWLPGGPPATKTD